MNWGVAHRVLPDSQRRTLDELAADLDLTAGDRPAKSSAFWIMLVLSTVIASAGVLADSTATVIGAMIVAPLSTPIMGMALGLAKGSRSALLSSGWYVLRGVVLVVALGALFSLSMPTSSLLLSNGQIAGRTSPGLADLLAAVATGFAGAIALARRDVAAVLPGVAIAISLVPPLAVVGVCLGQGAVGLAMGALLLFTSNLLALVLAGTLVFTATGYTREAAEATGRSSRRRSLTLTVMLLVVGVPLALNSAVNYLIAVVTERARNVAEEWVADDPQTDVTNVDFSAQALTIQVRTPGGVPDTAALMEALEGVVPTGIPVTVVTSLGDSVDVGTVGDR